MSPPSSDVLVTSELTAGMMARSVQLPAGASSAGFSSLPPVASEQKRARSTTWASRALSYVELVKPRVTRVVIATALLGAIAAPGRISPGVLTLSVLGTVLVVGAANVLNMVLEWRTDALMERTRQRPIPAGLVRVEDATRFGWSLFTAGLLTLWFTVNATTAALSAFAFVVYLWVYTPLKRRSPIALYAGAVPGAVPPLLGWTAATGTLSPAAFSLFAMLFIWQIPHFHAIALFRRDEYQRAGLRVLPVVDGVNRTRFAVVAWAAVLVPVSLGPWFFGIVDQRYLLIALVSSSAFLLLAALGIRESQVDPWARRVFAASIPHLLILYAALAWLAG